MVTTAGILHTSPSSWPKPLFSGICNSELRTPDQARLNSVGPLRWATTREAAPNPMDPTPPSNDDALADGLARWLTEHRGLGQVTLSPLERPSAGYSSETLIVDATWSDDGQVRHQSLVVRMAPAGAGTFPHYDLVAQWQAQSAAAEVGVPVADPVLEQRCRLARRPLHHHAQDRRAHRRRAGPSGSVAARTDRIGPGAPVPQLHRHPGRHPPGRRRCGTGCPPP